MAKVKSVDNCREHANKLRTFVTRGDAEATLRADYAVGHSEAEVDQLVADAEILWCQTHGRHYL